MPQVWDHRRRFKLNLYPCMGSPGIAGWHAVHGQLGWLRWDCEVLWLCTQGVGMAVRLTGVRFLDLLWLLGFQPQLMLFLQVLESLDSAARVQIDQREHALMGTPVQDDFIYLSPI